MCYICEIIGGFASHLEGRPFASKDLSTAIKQKISANILFHLGNGVKFENVYTAIDFLMRRDYKNARKIVIPERFVTKIPNVIFRDREALEEQISKIREETEKNVKTIEVQVLEMRREAEQKVERLEDESQIAEVRRETDLNVKGLEDRIEGIKEETEENVQRLEKRVEEIKKETKKILEKWRSRTKNMDGEKIERNLYDALVEYYQESDDVLILHDYEVLRFDFKTGNNDRMEKDILIVDGNYKFIMNIEAKTTLNEKNVKVAKKQLDNMKNLAESWLGNVVTPEWKFISALYTEKIPNQACNSDFLFVGPKLDNWKGKLDKLRVHKERQETDDVFYEIVKHLVYFATATPTNVATHIHDKESKGVDKAGEPESIAFWNWKPVQKHILDFGYRRIILDSCFGSGKTMIMVAKAIFLGKKRKEKVAFLVAHLSERVSLLYCMLKKEFENIDNITVEVIDWNAKERAMEILMRHQEAHLFIDEVWAINGTPPKAIDELVRQSSDSKRHIWITIGYVTERFGHNWKCQPHRDAESYEEWLLDLMENHDFHHPKLEYVLRNSKNVALKKEELMKPRKMDACFNAPTLSSF